MDSILDINIFFNKLKPFLKHAPEKVRDIFLSEMGEFVSEWADTIDIYSDLKTIQEINEAEKAFVDGKGVEWIEGMYTHATAKQKCEAVIKILDKGGNTCQR